MKKIILILLVLIFANTTQSQWDPWSYYKTPPVTANPINARAQLFFNRVDSLGFTLTTLQKSVYNNIFQRLQDSTLIGSSRSGDKIVSIYNHGKKFSPDTTVLNMNILYNQYNLVHYGTVTYTDSCVYGDGSTGYLKTGFTPSADSSIYKLNSAGLAIWSLKVGSAGSTMGCFITDRASLLYGGATTYTANHGGAGNTPSFATSSLGFGSMSRTQSSDYKYYKNGIYFGNPSVAQVSNQIPNKQIYICAWNTATNAPGSFSSEYIAISVIKGGLTATEERMLFNILKLALQELSINTFAVKTVKPSGGDYTTVAAALAGITDATVGTQYNIIIYPSTYEEEHLQMKNYVHLVGTDQTTCIINGAYPNNQDTATIQNNSTIEWSGITSNISNLTIKMTNGRYVIHDDDNSGTKSITNCVVTHLGNAGADANYSRVVWAYMDGFGHGWGSGQPSVLSINNCTFTGKRYGFASHTKTAAGTYASNMNISNCLFYSTSANPKYSFRIYYAYDNGDVYTLTNCTINDGMYIEGAVSPIGKIVLNNTTYGSLYCQQGTCF